MISWEFPCFVQFSCQTHCSGEVSQWITLSDVKPSVLVYYLCLPDLKNINSPFNLFSTFAILQTQPLMCLTRLFPLTITELNTYSLFHNVFQIENGIKAASSLKQPSQHSSAPPCAMTEGLTHHRLNVISTLPPSVMIISALEGV